MVKIQDVRTGFGEISSRRVYEEGQRRDEMDARYFKRSDGLYIGYTENPIKVMRGSSREAKLTFGDATRQDKASRWPTYSLHGGASARQDKAKERREVE